MLFAIGLAVGMSAAQARSCPEEIYGGWTTDLPVESLLRTRLVVSNRDDERIELNQPPVRFVGEARSDSGALDGFVYFGQNAYRVTLPRTDKGTWSGTWVPLPAAESALTFDLYIDDDGGGGTGAYFFFRDQRMPSLYGLGARCDGDSITFSELNLGLTFSGRFDDKLTVLTTEATGLGGTATVIWKRMSEEQLSKPAGYPDLPPRDPNGATFVDHAPEASDDGWPTAKPSERGVEAFS